MPSLASVCAESPSIVHLICQRAAPCFFPLEPEHRTLPALQNSLCCLPLPPPSSFSLA
ncbi:hypothetical protein MC885_010998 [Smutsia gigantea]|nr:hypothetical protein MC885_010998 [Smutsia gigantea]